MSGKVTDSCVNLFHFVILRPFRDERSKDLKNFPFPVLDQSGDHFKSFFDVYGTETSEVSKKKII